MGGAWYMKFPISKLGHNVSVEILARPVWDILQIYLTQVTTSASTTEKFTQRLTNESIVGWRWRTDRKINKGSCRESTIPLLSKCGMRLGSWFTWLRISAFFAGIQIIVHRVLWCQNTDTHALSDGFPSRYIFEAIQSRHFMVFDFIFMWRNAFHLHPLRAFY